MGLALAIATQIIRWPGLNFLANGLSGTSISTPAAALALVFLLLALPPAFAAALLIFPRFFVIHRICCNRVQRCRMCLPRGQRRRAVPGSLPWHVAPIALPQLIALVGVSISIGIGVLLPIEVVSDVAGIGRLPGRRRNRATCRC